MYMYVKSDVTVSIHICMHVHLRIIICCMHSFIQYTILMMKLGNNMVLRIQMATHYVAILYQTRVVKEAS